MSPSISPRIVGSAFIGLLCVVFVKNFWLNEDAYIIFRSLEQLLAGHGAVWNTGERVQVYTSIAWYWILAAVNTIFHDVFVSVILVSASMFAGLLLILRRGFGDSSALYFLLACFVLSKGFFDYTSSGLENILCYFILTALYMLYRRVEFAAGNQIPESRLQRIALLTAVVPLLRHDLLLIGIPPFVCLLWYLRSNRHTFFRLLIVAVLPILLWTLGSLVYYGVPLPNTAYAKLSHGFPSAGTIVSGINYFRQNLRVDPLTLGAIFVAPLAAAIAGGGACRWAFVCGLLGYCMYLCKAGGDYMQGRFLGFPFLIAMLLIADAIRRYRISSAEAAAGAIFIVLYPFLVNNTPLVTPWTYGREIDDEALLQESRSTGLLDQRPLHYPTTIAAWWLDETRHPGVIENFRREGEELGRSKEAVTVRGAVGNTGYYAGLDVHIVDFFALTDPLLSHLPALYRWLSGHFSRETPKGYVEYLAGNAGSLEDKKIDLYFRKVELLTRSKHLFSVLRLKAIVEFNTGKYEYLLTEYRDDLSRRHFDTNKIPGEAPR